MLTRDLFAIANFLVRYGGPSARSNGVGTNFGVGVGEAVRRPRAGDGVLGEGTTSPSPPTRGFAGAL